MLFAGKPKLKKHLKSFKGGQITDFIVGHGRAIETVFGVLFLLSAFFNLFVGVNYDLTEYLPADAPSSLGISRMEEEFGYPGTARVMVDHVTLSEAKLYKDKIAAVDGVDQVMWADSVTDVYQAEEFIDSSAIADYYKDGHSVMDVTFEEGDYSTLTSAAVDRIREIVGPKGHLVGPSVQDQALSRNMKKEMRNTMAIGVVLIALILCLSTTSWFEPLLFLTIMGVAIVINQGTNIFLGTISFLTSSVSSVLQLACSMDYSIFLLHAFTRRKQAGEEPVQAMKDAWEEAVKSILPSGATTVAGFIVLVFMKFSIGFDLGIVLAKGIVISLITVLFLMPTFILQSYRLVEKTAHRPFLPSFRLFGKAAYRARYWVLAGMLVLAVPAYVGQGMNHFVYGNSTMGAGPGTQVYADEQAIDAVFGRSNLLLVLCPNTSMVKEKQLSDELKDLPDTKSVVSLASELPEGVPESILPSSLTGKLHTDRYARMLVYVRTKDESDLAFQVSDEVKAAVEKYYPQDSFVLGATPSTQDIKTSINSDYGFVNMLSLLGVALVVFLSFRSLFLPLLVLIPIEMAVFLNMTFPYLVGDSMVFMGYLIVSSLQLGATVDYSILMTNNYLDRRSGMDKREAAVESIAVSAPSVLTSGMILASVGYIMYFTSSIAAIGDMGHLIGRGALLSMAMVLFLLPALLALFDGPILRRQERHAARMQRIRERLLSPAGPSPLPARHPRSPKAAFRLPAARRKRRDSGTGTIGTNTKDGGISDENHT